MACQQALLVATQGKCQPQISLVKGCVISLGGFARRYNRRRSPLTTRCVFVCWLLVNWLCSTWLSRVVINDNIRMYVHLGLLP